MRTANKIKGVMATAGITYEDLARLSGITRGTLHQYLNNPAVDIEDYPNGLVVMRVADRIMKLCSEEVLPLQGVPKTEKVERLGELLV